MKDYKSTSTKSNIFFLLIAISLCVLIAILSLEKIKAALLVSLALLVISVAWYHAHRVDVKKVMLVFFFIYPLLPCMAGFQVGGGIPVFRAHRIATIIIILFLLSRGLFWEYFKKFFKSNIFSYYLLFLFLTMSITSLLSDNKIGSIFIVLSLLIESVILSVIVFNIFITEKDFDSLIGVMCYSALILSCLGLYERFFQHNVFFWFGVFDPERYAGVTTFQIRYGEIRIQGPFDHSIAFAGYLVGALPAALYRFRNNILLFNVSLGLIGATIILTQSRAGLIGLIIVYFLYFALISWKNMIPSIIIGLLILAPNLPSIIEHYWGMDQALDSEYFQSERMRQFNFLSEYIIENPVFGYGAAPVPALLRMDTWGFSREYASTIDNYYLLYTFHWGFAGLFTYLVFHFSLFVKSVLIFKVKILNNKLLLLSLIAVFAIMIINIVVALWSFLFIVWIYIGIIARMIENRKNELKSKI